MTATINDYARQPLPELERAKATHQQGAAHCSGQFSCAPVRHAFRFKQNMLDKQVRIADSALNILCSDRGIRLDFYLRNALTAYGDTAENMRSMLDNPEAARQRMRDSMQLEFNKPH